MKDHRILKQMCALLLTAALFRLPSTYVLSYEIYHQNNYKHGKEDPVTSMTNYFERDYTAFPLEYYDEDNSAEDDADANRDEGGDGQDDDAENQGAKTESNDGKQERS